MKPQGLINFTVVEEETDLHISANINLEIETRKHVRIYRQQIIDYISKNPLFKESLIPIEVDSNSPEIVRHMAWAGEMAQVGPMASVAGAIAHYVGNALLKSSNEIIVENGGDIFINSKKERSVLISAGNSLFSDKLAIIIKKERMPLGICTSAGTVGHSLSFGNADAVVILSKDTLLADAVATAVANIIKTVNDINTGIDYGNSIKGVEGILVIIEDKLGVWGNVELTK